MLIIQLVDKISKVIMDSQRQALDPNNANEPVLHTVLISGKSYQRTKYLIFLVACLCLSPFYYGFTLTYISTINSHILSLYFGPQAGKPLTIGVLIGIVPIGAGFGALLASLFMGFLTRKNFLLFFNTIAILVSGVLQINNLWVLLSCRFVQGFIIGNYMGVVPIYIKQLTPIPLRGSMGAMSQFFNIGAVVVCYFLALVFDISDVNQQFYWRFMFSFTAFTVILQSALLLFDTIPESPISLIQAGKLKQAKQVLALFNAPQALDDVYSQYFKQSNKNKFQLLNKKQHCQSKTTSQNQSVELSLMKKNQSTFLFKIQDELEIGRNQMNILMSSSLSEQRGENQQVSSKLKNVNQMDSEEASSEEEAKISIKAFIIGFELPLMQQFSGVKTIVTEIGIIIHEYNRGLSLYAPFVINLVQLAATACSILVLIHFGRRSIIVGGNLGVAVCSVAVACFFLAIQLTQNSHLVFGAMGLIIVFMVIYGLTIGPAVWLYVPEIIPSKFVPAATFMNWLGVSISVIVTPIVLEKYGSPYPVFMFFGCISLLFWAINYFLVIETKGLRPSEIAEKLAPKQPKKHSIH